MSTSGTAVIERFMDQAGTENPRLLRPRTANAFVGRSDWRLPYDDTVYSYGTHFPLAQLMPDGNEQRGWWLLNGDSWRGASSATPGHQRTVQEKARASGLPVMIVPFSAMASAGIRRDTVKIVDVLPERWTWEPRERRESPSSTMLEYPDSYGTRNWKQRESDGMWTYEEHVHHLGESLFTAEYAYTARTREAYVDFSDGMRRVPAKWEDRRGTAYFLSAFDENEPGFLYFLAQLPDGAEPATVADAFEALKPQQVKEYERARLPFGPVLRQGDVFAIPTDYQTRELPGPSKRDEHVLNVSHKATEIRIDGMGRTFARGFLRHRPVETWRNPEHRRVQLGDRKQWYELVKNTVPMHRAWALGGNVD